MIKRIISTVSAVVMGFSCMIGMHTAFSDGENGPAVSAATSSVTKIANNYVDLPYERLGGANRFATAAAVSKKAYPNGTENVVIACDADYADALCATPLAKALDAPILLTANNVLPKETIAEVKRLGAKTVYLVGNDACTATFVEDGLQQYGIVKISGKDKFGTCARVASFMKEIAEKPSLTAFLASANDFPDALSISSIAAVKGSPVLYVDKSGKLSEEVKSYLASSGKKLGFAYIIGGSGAISDDVYKELEPYFNQWRRYGGSNRYETNNVVNNAFQSTFKGKDLYLATGKNYPDAMTGSVLAAKNESPLMIADNKPTYSQTKYLKNVGGITESKANTLHIFGGEAVVSLDMAKEIMMIHDPKLSVADGGTKATLSWSSNSFITSYQIYRDGNLLATIKDPFTTTYKDSGINKSETYTYRVIYNYKIKGKVYVSDASHQLLRKGAEYLNLLNSVNSARLNSEKNNTPKYTFKTENAQPSRSTFTYYDIRYSLNDWETLEKFAKKHFTSSMTKAEKVAYTVNWINKNVWYGTVANGGWAKIMAMVNNRTFSYVNCIFNYKIGQCNCYNGALASMMLYLGYDAHLVMGFRGKTSDKGLDRGGYNHWQHFWCEVKINGQTYVMEAGNYGEDGDWMHVCEKYKDVEYQYKYTENKVTKTGWSGYIKNGKIVL